MKWVLGVMPESKVKTFKIFFSCYGLYFSVTYQKYCGKKGRKVGVEGGRQQGEEDSHEMCHL